MRLKIVNLVLFNVKYVDILVIISQLVVGFHTYTRVMILIQESLTE